MTLTSVETPSRTGADARLIADIGGTNARFAWQAGPGTPLLDTQVLQVADFARLQDAIRAYVDGIGRGIPRAVAVAIANPITGDQVHMTNADWSFSQAAVKAEFGLRTFRLLNDFTALALALPDLPATELRQVGGVAPVPRAPIALVGAGTGLGVSGLIPVGDAGWLPLSGEGGHVTLPAVTARERLVMDGLTLRYGHASAERLVCGQGLFDTFVLLCQSDGVATGSVHNAAGVLRGARHSGGQSRAHAGGARRCVRGWRHRAAAGRLVRRVALSRTIRGQGPIQAILEQHPGLGDHLGAITGPSGRRAFA